MAAFEQGRTAGQSHLYAIARKELRVLLPVWIGGMILVALVFMLPRDSAHPVLWAVRGVARACAWMYLLLLPCVLGALSMGHDFAHGTWSFALSQPITRARLLAVKTSLVALLTITAVAAALAGLGFEASGLRGAMAIFGDSTMVAQITLVALVCGVVLAPLFTLLCRGTSAGVLLAAAMPVLGHAVILLSAYLASGSSLTRPLPRELVPTAWTAFMVIVGVVAAWGLARSFLRFEVRESQSSDLLSWWPAPDAPADTRSRFSPARVIVTKELRLQVPAATMGAVFASMWIGLALTADRDPAAFPVLWVGFGIVMSLLAGAVVSAEERRLGTLGDQLLLPMPLWLQWVLKVAAMFAATWMLTVVLPAILTALGPEDIRATVLADVRDAPWAWFAYPAGIATVALYASSVSRGGFPATLAALAIGLTSVMVTGVLMGGVLGARGWWGAVFSPLAIERAALISASAVAALALYFALQNHRQVDRSSSRVVRQTVSMWGTFVAGCLLVLWLN
jgi:hypothetical protein